MNAVSSDIDNADKGFNLRTQSEPANAGNLSDDFKELHAYWDSLRDGAFAPSWARFDWSCVSPQIIPRCAVVDVRRHPLDFVYRFWGTRRTSVQGADYTGKTLRDLRPKAIAEKSFREYCNVIAERSPLLIRTHSPAIKWAPAFDYEFLRLPFSDSGEEVNQILSIGQYDPTVMKLVMDLYDARPAKESMLDKLLERLQIVEVAAQGN
ncbi:MAG: PAS domain-containing protein [Rhodospirillales bacterium]|nr:PAS domain-containing protein [Rhodospirillales bacterium]MBO6787318.1 PAS domain-containing protein [Rhodospirillales bacterium]